MSDNTTITPGFGATIAADDVGGVLYQRVKVATGADGAATDVSSANPMPVTFPTPPAVTVSGTPTVQVTNTPAVTVANTPAVTVSGTPNVAVTNTPNVAVTNTPAVTVSGTPNVAVTNVPHVVVDSGAVTVGNTSGSPVNVTLPNVTKAAPLPVSLFDANATGLNVDAFGRLRVGQAFTLADLIMRYEIDARDWLQVVSGGGSISYLPNEQAARVAVSASSGAAALLQTNEYYRYQAGKAQWIRMTGYHSDAGQSNQVRRWGYFDAANGLFFQLSGSVLSLVRRSSTSGIAVDTVVNQSNWNVDKLNGTGPSGITLDLAKTQIYEIEFQHLAVGSVYWRVNGVLVHVSSHANVLSVSYMTTAQLPVAVQVTNSGASSSGSFTQICASVESHGGTEHPAETFSAPGAPASIAVASTEIPLLSIRVASLYRGKANRMLIIPSEVSISGDIATRFRLILNATLTGASWAAADSRSGVEVDTSASAFSGGQTIWARTYSNATPSDSKDLGNVFGYPNRVMRLNGDASAQDVLTVTAVRVAASGTDNCRASLVWGEIR